MVVYASTKWPRPHRPAESTFLNLYRKMDGPTSQPATRIPHTTIRIPHTFTSTQSIFVLLIATQHFCPNKELKAQI